MESHRLLFIGNSHTYLHYMPLMLVQLYQAAGYTLHTDQVTDEGVSLEWHWSNNATWAKIQEADWSHVILQDRSGGPLEDRQSFYKHARLLNSEITKQGAKTVFYMTWANKRRPETQKLLAEAYLSITRELDAMLAPVGLAWERALSQNPKLDLHHKDGRHASKTGAYLTACVFFFALNDSNTIGFPGNLRLGDRILVDLEDSQAAFLETIAYETVSSNR